MASQSSGGKNYSPHETGEEISSERLTVYLGPHSRHRQRLCPPWGGSATGEAWATPDPEGEGIGEGVGARAWVTWPCRPPRAPVLVALALIESGMKYEDAIQFIRQ